LPPLPALVDAPELPPSLPLLEPPSPASDGPDFPADPAAPAIGVALPAVPLFELPASAPENGDGLPPQCRVTPAQPTNKPPSMVFRQMARTNIGRGKHVMARL